MDAQYLLKRKRSVSESLDDDEAKLKHKLHHGLKEIRKAAKKAKVFEIQKTVKRLKNLRKMEENSSDIMEHNAQLIALKNIEHDIVANSATKSKILKDHVLSHNEQVLEALSREIGDHLLPTSNLTASGAKVQSRLLSSRILAAELSSLVEELRILLGHPPKTNPLENIATTSKASVVRTTKVKNNNWMSSSVVQPDIEDDLSGNDEEWESGSIDDEQHENANSSELRSMSCDLENGREDKYKEGKGNEDSRDDELPNGDSRSRDGVSANKRGRTAIPNKISSTFLPSLSVGFVRGSNDSDWSDSEAKIADVGKKNRRGQRARRAIWEKKYGRNANHKKKELEARQAEDIRRKKSYRNPPRSSDFHASERSLRQGSDQTTIASERAQGSLSKSERQVDRPLHPSWEAKRKLREKQSVTIVPSQGTKIKFSD